jgi:hypothetical protein
MFGEACLSCTRATLPLVKDFLARRSRAETPSPTQRLPDVDRSIAADTGAAHARLEQEPAVAT